MSEQVDEIRCRLCATYFPESSRFCPNCREPRTDVHEDLLMAARLTGVSYEILLQRAWAEDGIIRIRQPDQAIAQGATQPMETLQPAFVQRLLGQRDTATIGCLVFLGIVLVAVVGILAVMFIRDNFGGSDKGSQAVQPTSAASPTATTTATPTLASGGTGGTGAGSGGAGQGTPSPTPNVVLLILNPALPAIFSDGSQARLVTTNLSVIGGGTIPSPPVGLRYVAIQVEVCAGSGPVTSAPGDWQLEMPNGERLAPVTPVAVPNLETATLAASNCNLGWITFEAPVTTSPAYVLMSNTTHEVIRYAWPE